VTSSPETDRPPLDLGVLQANERTLFAWLRTSMGLMAFGFVVARLGVWHHELASGEDDRPAVSRSLLFGAGLVNLDCESNVVAAARYHRTRRAILHGEPAPLGALAPLVLAFALAAAAAGLAGVLVLR